MVFNSELFDELSRQAKETPRLRQFFDLRDSEDDTCQRMLNALEPGTIIKIHKHPLSSALTIVLRGSVSINIYDDNGNVIKQTILSREDSIGYTVLENEWHNLVCLEPNTIIYEQKSGKYNPETDAVFLNR